MCICGGRQMSNQLLGRLSSFEESGSYGGATLIAVSRQGESKRVGDAYTPSGSVGSFKNLAMTTEGDFCWLRLFLEESFRTPSWM